MSKINAAKTLGIKHRLDLDLDSNPSIDFNVDGFLCVFFWVHNN